MKSQKLLISLLPDMEYFFLGDEVEYRDLCGVIAFICDDYSILKLPAVGENNSARLIIFKQYYSNVKVLKNSKR